MPLKTETFEITRWLGLNTYDNIVDTDPRFVSDCLNVDFDTQGIVTKRRGVAPASTTVTFTSTINMIYDFQCQQGFTSVSDRLRTLVVSGSTLYVIQNFAQASMTISASFAATDTLHYGTTSNNGICFISNENGGVPKMLAYVDSAWVYQAATLSSPSTASTVSTTTGATLDGVYRARYTYEDEWGNESNPNPESADCTLTADALLVAVIGSPDPTVEWINVYVMPPSNSIYFYSGTISNTDGNYVHTWSDARTMAQDELEYDHFPIPEGKYVKIYNDMLLVAGDPDVPDTIWPSHPQFLREFSGTEFARCTTGDGQPIKGFGQSYNDVVVAKADSLFLARGTDDTTFNAIPHNNEYGVLGQPSMTFVWQRFCFFSDDGVYVDDSIVPTEISKRIRTSLRQLNAANLAHVPPRQFAANYKYYKKLLFTAKDRATDGENDILFVYNYELDIWTKWTGCVPKYMAAVQNYDDYEYLYGGNAAGNLYQFIPPNALNANSDILSGTIGTTISSYIETPWINLPKAAGHPDWEFSRTEPRFIKIYAGGEPASGNSTISLVVTYKTDFVETTVNNTFTLTFAATAWPGQSLEAKYIRSFGGTLGHFNWIKLKIANGLKDEHFRIEKILFGFKARPAVD